MIKRLTIMVAALICALTVNADVRFKNIYQNNMVLQAGEKNVIAGKADVANQDIALKLVATQKDGKKFEKVYNVKSDKNRRWQVEIPAFPKRTNIELTVSANGVSKSIRDIVTGELWIGSGQSNMEWHFGNASVDKDFREKYKQDADSMNGDVRTFRVEHIILPEAIDEVRGDWRKVNAREIQHSSVSQVCYIFATKISKELDTPVGIINSSWGGSKIEPWIPKEAFLKSPIGKEIYERQTKDLANYNQLRENYLKNYPKWLEENPTNELQNKNRATRPQLPTDVIQNNQLPSCMFNAMINGIAPLAPKGVLWYQGESNAGQPYEYGELKKLLVNSWRSLFKKEFYFYYVELAAFTNTQDSPVQYGSWGGVRETQAEVLELPKTGVACSIDNGGSEVSGQGDIHPPHKELVSTRLANMALAQIYKKGNPAHTISPAFKSMKIEGNKAIIELSNAEGLTLMHQPELCTARDLKTPPPAKITGFAIRGDNARAWKWADVEIQNGKLIVSSPEVDQPKAVRYAWASWPLSCLKNKYGLPLRPFSTDNGAYVDWGKTKPSK